METVGVVALWLSRLVRLFVAQKARIRIPIGTFFSTLIVYQCRKGLFIFSSFSYPGTQWYIVLLLVPISETRDITFPFLLSKTILFLFGKDRFVSAEYSFRLENPLAI